MKKILCLCFAIMFSALRVFASDVKFVQIDNLKYTVSEEAVKSFADTIRQINKEKNIDFVIFSGNNIAKSDKKLLKKFLRQAKRLNCPYYVALGHKDLNKKKGLSKTAYIDTVNRITFKRIKNSTYVFVKKGVVFIVADGAKEFIATPFGYYRDSVVNYVDRELRKHENENVVILQHFPLYPPSDEEDYRTYNAQAYMKMLDTHTNVKAVVSGFGVNNETDINGVKHITTASYPKYRIIEIIDCNSAEPTIWTSLK